MRRTRWARRAIAGLAGIAGFRRRGPVRADPRRIGPRRAPARQQPGSIRHNADFLTYWGGQSVSLLGTQVTRLALPLTAVLLLRATPAQMGALGALEYAPFLLFTLVAGVHVDRSRRRPILIAADAGRAALLLAVPALALAGALRIELLYAVAFLVGVCTVWFYLANQAYIPALVPPERTVAANARLAASESAADMIGPGLGGLLVQALAAPLALLADALSYVVSVATLWRIRAVEPTPPRPERRLPVRAEIGEGFRVTFGNPYLRALLGEAASYNLFWQVVQTVFLLYAVRALGMSPGALGLVLALGSAGAVLGALVTGRAARIVGVGRVIVASVALSDLAPLLLPLAPGASRLSAPLLALGLFATGAGTTACNVHTVSLRQRLVPAHLQGRMNACYRLVAYGSIAVGALLGGLLGERVGLRTTLLVGALGLLTSLIFVLASPVPRLETLPTAEPFAPDGAPHGRERTGETDARAIA